MYTVYCEAHMIPDKKAVYITIAIISAFAKFESEKISERTKAGLERVRAEGKKLGRPTIPQETIDEVLQYLKDGKLSYSQISKRVIYKIKYGKEKHISPAQISQIKKKCCNGTFTSIYK